MWLQPQYKKGNSKQERKDFSSWGEGTTAMAAMAEEACGNQETEDETTVRAPVTFKGLP